MLGVGICKDPKSLPSQRVPQVRGQTKTKQNNHRHKKKELVKCRASFRVGVLRRTLGREGKEGYVDGVWSWGVIAPRGEV